MGAETKFCGFSDADQNNHHDYTSLQVSKHIIKHKLLVHYLK